MKTNTVQQRPKIFTHEGAVAQHINPVQQLRRSVMSCLLWESEFYESGKLIADRITEFADQVDDGQLASIIVEARVEHGLRHAPLLMLLSLIKRGGPKVAPTIDVVMKRADDMTELVNLYWMKNPGKMMSRQMKLGLARAFNRFNEYQLAKYDRDGNVLLRDVLRLARPKPKDEAQSALFDRVNNRTMATPDTWEVALSGGEDKRTAFTRLLEDHVNSNGKIGIPYLAILRNLRNMVDSGVSHDLIKNALLTRNGARWVFPFRFTAAARAVPQLEPVIDAALLGSIAEQIPLAGRTAILVDVSDSMNDPLSAKSDLTRMDAAATLASVFAAEQLRMFTFSDHTVEVPPRRGMAGIDAIKRSQPHHSTALFDAVHWVNTYIGGYERLIIITDEQANGINHGFTGTRRSLPDPISGSKGYVINVASAKNGVGYGAWTHIDGFSEAVIKYIHQLETDRFINANTAE